MSGPGEIDSQFSSIKPGTFAAGAQLPWEHPDMQRILNALDDKDPETNIEHQRLPATGQDAIDPRDINEILNKAKTTIENYPGKFDATQRDYVVKTFLMNYLSVNRAAGTFPDKLFYSVLYTVKTPKGRQDFLKIISPRSHQ